MLKLKLKLKSSTTK